MPSPILSYTLAGTPYTLDSRNRVLCRGELTDLTIRRGSYQGTPDDRADRWYVCSDVTDYHDVRGAGYATRAAALESAADQWELIRTV